MVLYRKYRPQKLEELDLQEVRERLARFLSSSFTPHAFLFSGPKGTGKTSAARIIAKILNCEKTNIHNPQSKGTAIEPCNNCESCVAITEGRHMDILEIDAASNRGIDEVRDLREKIKLLPTSARFKVYIIDEVHMMTTEAFNALLKTLEEPPNHAVFILATTEPDRLPETIVSRCVKVPFRKATDEEVGRSLLRVVKGEGLHFEKNMIEAIAKFAEGSFRDATKMLEQVITEDVKDEEALFALLGKDTVNPEVFLPILVAKKSNDAIAMIVAMGKKGADLRYFTTSLLNLLHHLLLASHGIDEEKAPKTLKEQFSVNEIIGLLKLFSRVYVELRGASRGEIPLEVAIVEWCEGKVANNKEPARNR